MTLIDYITGNRHGKEANQLEKQSLEDAFLQDAIDGFDAVEADHLSAIERINKRIIGKNNEKFRRLYVALAMAASFLLLITAGTLYFWQPSRDLPVIAQAQAEAETGLDTQIQEEDTLFALVAPSEILAYNNVEKLARLEVAAAEAITEDLAADKIVTQHELKESAKAPMQKTQEEEAMKTKIDEEKSETLEEEVVLDYSAARKRDLTGAAATVEAKKAADLPPESANESKNTDTFNEAEFRAFVQKRAKKEICGNGKTVVKIVFDIDEKAKPSNYQVLEYSCEKAKQQILRLLRTSPNWTNTGRNVKMEIEW